MLDRRIHLNIRWALTTCLVATGLILSQRDVPAVTANPMPALARPERPRPERAQDIRTAFSEIAYKTDWVRRDARLHALAGRWIGASPEEALAFATNLPPGEVRDTFLRHLCVAWARKDAEEVLAWSDRLDSPADRRGIRSTVCIAVAESDPRLALELALQHGSDGDENDSLLDNLSAQWADREPAAALDWVRTQPGGEWHDRLMARVGFVLSKSDPHAAACHVAEDMEPGPMQDEAVISVLHQWAMQDAESAAQWVETGIPDGQLRERALAELDQAISLMR